MLDTLAVRRHRADLGEVPRDVVRERRIGFGCGLGVGVFIAVCLAQFAPGLFTPVLHDLGRGARLEAFLALAAVDLDVGAEAVAVSADPLGVGRVHRSFRRRLRASVAIVRPILKDQSQHQL